MPSNYSVSFTRSARKDLAGFDAQMTRRMGSAVDALEIDPRPAGCIKVKSEDGAWRIQVGEYRIGYIIDDTAQLITIVRIGHRSDFYG
jgi:mRNA interferase RelE/StbE